MENGSLVGSMLPSYIRLDIADVFVQYSICPDVFVYS
jgi:hypothetical protein